MVIRKTSIVQIITRKTPDGESKFFRTQVPKDFALDELGLNTDDKKQKLIWLKQKGKIIVTTHEENTQTT